MRGGNQFWWLFELDTDDESAADLTFDLAGSRKARQPGSHRSKPSQRAGFMRNEAAWILEGWRALH